MHLGKSAHEWESRQAHELMTDHNASSKDKPLSCAVTAIDKLAYLFHRYVSVLTVCQEFRVRTRVSVETQDLETSRECLFV